MASRTAKVASSIVAGILAGVPLTAPHSAANAAECLTEPGKDATQSRHWYYRIEHGTKRHCWYLRDEGGKVSQAAQPDGSGEAPKAVTRQTENPPRSLEDARAEFPMPQGRESTAAALAPAPVPLANSAVPTAPQADAQGSTVAARWPSPDAAAAPPAPTPAATDATDASPATDAAADAPADAATPAPAPVALNAAPAKPSASLQMLFAAIGGALALAGLTASIVYRLGRRRRKRRLDPSERRAAIWEGVHIGPKPPWVESVVEETAPLPTPERRAAQRATPQERYEKIEEILAQLVRQAQESDA